MKRRNPLLDDDRRRALRGLSRKDLNSLGTVFELAQKAGANDKREQDSLDNVKLLLDIWEARNIWEEE